MSSNNAARIRMWLYLHRSEDLAFSIERTAVKHEEQHQGGFGRVNPFEKIPALTIDDSGASSWLAEAAVILEFLEDLQQSVRPASARYVPSSPEERAHMRLVIRTHDLYISSPNCTQEGPFTHSQGCMYVPPPSSSFATTRWQSRAERAARLADCWKQLDILDGLVVAPFFTGPRMSLADMAVFPTLVFFCFLTPRVFGWEEGAVFHARSKLREWYTHMQSFDAAQRVRDEVLAGLASKEASGALNDIIAETRDTTHKWVYP